LGYPPYSRFVRLVYRSPKSADAEEGALQLARQLQATMQDTGLKIDLIGPSPCYFERIRGLYRWHLILRGMDPTQVLPDSLPEGWGIDIDPVSLL
jgi:primosomal protein N' (replication factor Y)